jgi:hypothetical protein
MASNTLLRIRENGGFLAQYTQGMSALWGSGIFEFLAEKAKPIFLKGEANPHIAALECARSSGYFECLEDLLHFRDLYLDIPKPLEHVPMDFGAIDAAERKGDLLKEEADAIRSGKPVSYEAFTSSGNESINGGDK